MTVTRRAHYIKENKGCESANEAVWFDTETKEKRGKDGSRVHTLWFGWGCYRRRREADDWTTPDWCRFTRAEQFWGWVDSLARPKTKLYVFCHNTSFDLPVTGVFTHLPALGWQLSQAMIDAPPTMLTFKKDNHTIVVLDTLNLWRMPLRKLGEMIGSRKLHMPPNDAPIESWNAYARQDVEVIMEACLSWWAFLRQEDLGGFAPTLASQAFRTYRHRFMPAPILADDDAQALTLARSSYFGGRCECFHIGAINQRVHLLDINSMYPYVMQKFQFPARLAGKTDRHGARALSRYAAELCLVAQVRLCAKAPVYPVVVNGRLCFPVGEFDAVLCGAELLYAVQAGEIISVGQVAMYEPEPLFREFVDEMYKRRVTAARNNDHTRAWLFKILMNSLYGKFGQKGIVWDNVGFIDDLEAKAWVEIHYPDGAQTKMRQLAGLLQRQRQENESRDSCPSIAAFVCSYARMELWKFINLAGRDNVFYVDTDSLLVNDQGLEKLEGQIDRSRLGALKLEGTFADAHIWGNKDYRFGDKEKHKGVRASARWLDANTVEQEKWSSLRGMLRAGNVGEASITKQVKHLSRRYSKGTVDAAGEVSPLLLFADETG